MLYPMILMISKDHKEQIKISELMNTEILGLVAQAPQTGVQQETGIKDMSQMLILNHQ